jgi:serine/threonine protein kinase
MRLPTDGSFTFGLKGMYRPVRLISEGGFGSVWVLNNHSLVCKFGLSDAALQNEISVLLQMHTTVSQLPALQRYIRIPRIIESGTCSFEGRSMEFVVMERFGADLSKLRDLRFSTELNRVYAILRAGVQILKGLYCMHTYMKLVHGDVKPTNFLFRSADLNRATTDELVFIDLGLARPVKVKNVPTSGINGTRSYASIHVQKKYLPTPRCDLESLGYMMLHFVDNSLPWNKEIRRKFRGNGKTTVDMSGSGESGEDKQRKELEAKIAKERVALSQKRQLKKRIIEGKCASDGESLLSEYLFAIYHMHPVPDAKTYKLLSKILYDTLQKLQNIAIDVQRNNFGAKHR